MNQHRLFAACLAVISMVGIASAHTMGESTNTCPVCDHTFTCMLDRSGTSFGMRLDLKPVGPTPAPWRVPVCTDCSFVIYDKDIPAEELERCRTIIATEDYAGHSERASYFLMGLIFEGLGKESNIIGHTFLKASWQEESEVEHLKEDLERSLKHFEIYLGRKESEDEEGYVTAQLLKGELLRRLGRFEQCIEYLTELRNSNAIEDDFLQQLIRYQIDLCKQKDLQPHELSEMEQKAE